MKCVSDHSSLFSMYGVSVRTHVLEGIYIPLMVRHELFKHITTRESFSPSSSSSYIIIFHCVILYNIVIIEFVDSIRRIDPGTPEVLHFKFLNISRYYTFKHSKHHHHYLQVISYPASVIIMLNNCNYILNNLSFFLFLF